MKLTEEQRERLITQLTQDRMESYADNRQVFAILEEALIYGRVGFSAYTDEDLVAEVEEWAPHLLDEILGDSDETQNI